MAPKLALALSTALTLYSNVLGFQPIGNPRVRTNHFLQHTFGLDSATVLANDSSSYSSTALFAKRKRKRRKDGPKPSSPKIGAIDSNEGLNVLDEEDELPDFDLDEETELVAKSTVSTSMSVTGSTGVVPSAASLDVNDPAVIEAMKATGDAVGNVSTKDLLRSRNRELEQKFVVDEVNTQVPSLAEYTSKRGGRRSSVSTQGTMGKKAARAEARRNAAIEAENANSEAEGNALNDMLSILPFVDKTEPGKEKSAIKILEEGTWACIYILVGWEIYINSPFFDRAAPLSPAVF